MTILDARNNLTETLRSLRAHESMVAFDASAFTRLADEMQKVTRMFDTPLTLAKYDLAPYEGLGKALAKCDLAPFAGIEKYDLAPFDLGPYEGIGAALEMHKGMVEMHKGMVEALEMHKGTVEALAAFKPGDGSIGLFSVTSGAFESFQAVDAGQGIDLRLQADPDDTSYFCARCKTELRVEIRGMWPTDLPCVGSFGLVMPCPKCAGPTDDGPPAPTRRYVREGNVYYLSFERKGR